MLCAPTFPRPPGATMRLVTVEVVAVALVAVVLATCCFVAGLRWPRAGRVTSTVVVSVVAALTILFGGGTLVVGDRENPDSIAVPVGSFFLALGLVIAALAVAAQLGREVGRWLAAAVCGLLGGFLLWATVSEPLEDDTAVGSMVLLLIGLMFIACTALLVGGSNLANSGETPSRYGTPPPSRQPDGSIV